MMLVGDAHAGQSTPPTDPLPIEPRGVPLPVIGRIIEPIYRAVIARRNGAFDAGRNVHRVQGAAGPIPVISIGNLSVGGTGKTPMVMHVLRLLLENGHRPCVAMRGYSKSKDGASDETDAYRRAFPDLPIVAQPDRIAGLRALLERVPPNGQPDRIVLDDGFQHRQIARDLDVVLIDATPARSVFDDRLLPAGWLREPVDGLRRASAVVLTHAELAPKGRIEQLREAIARHTAAPVSVSRHVWTGLKQRIGEQDQMLPLDVLIGQPVLGCCAIGHPEPFVQALVTNAMGDDGFSDVMMRQLPDHDSFHHTEVERLVRLARDGRSRFIVVTDKDWSKLRHLPDSTWPCPVVRPDLALVFDSGREEFDRLVLGARAT